MNAQKLKNSNKGGIYISSTKEYKNNTGLIGRQSALSDYIEVCNRNGIDITYSDIVCNQETYNKFDKWYQKAIKPFELIKYEDDNEFSVVLREGYYKYRLFSINSAYKNADGHVHEMIFRNYIDDNFPHLSNLINYDSESGMFCLYSDSIDVSEEAAYELSKLYKDDYKMMDIIKNLKSFDHETFKCNIKNVLRETSTFFPKQMLTYILLDDYMRTFNKLFVDISDASIEYFSDVADNYIENHPNYGSHINSSLHSSVLKFQDIDKSKTSDSIESDSSIFLDNYYFHENDKQDISI